MCSLNTIGVHLGGLATDTLLTMGAFKLVGQNELSAVGYTVASYFLGLLSHRIVHHIGDRCFTRTLRVGCVMTNADFYWEINDVALHCMIGAPFVALMAIPISANIRLINSSFNLFLLKELASVVTGAAMYIFSKDRYGYRERCIDACIDRMKQCIDACVDCMRGHKVRYSYILGLDDENFENNEYLATIDKNFENKNSLETIDEKDEINDGTV